MHRFLSGLVAFAMAAAACGGGAATAPSAGPSARPTAAPATPSPTPVPRPAVVVGSTNFYEQTTLGELYAQILEANGYKVTRKFNLGNREIVQPALQSGQIDILAEYLATLLVFVNKDAKATTDAKETAKLLADAIKPKGLAVLDPAAATDQNGFVVTKATADKYALKKLSDLGAVAKDLVLGGPAECPQRPFCAVGLEKTYGAKFRDFKPLDAGGPLTVAALEGRQIDVALIFTSDPSIVAKGFVLLEDDKHLQLADNIAPVVRADLLAKDDGTLTKLLNGVSAKLSQAELNGMNKDVSVDKKDSSAVAKAWLAKQGLVK